MKLWFEGWNVNAKHAVPRRPERFRVKACPALDAGVGPGSREGNALKRNGAALAVIAAPKGAINALAVDRLRGDSAANNLA
jgi:hypothetical protein